MARKSFISFFLAMFCFFSALAQNITQSALAEEYYNNGELEKAYQTYQELVKEENNWLLIHRNYFKLLLEFDKLKEADKYLNKRIKKNPNNIHLLIDAMVLAQKENNQKEFQKQFEKIKVVTASTQSKTQVAAYYMQKNIMWDQAVELYNFSREKINDPYIFALELATIYRHTGKRNEMMEEYFLFLQHQPNKLEYVQSILQSVFEEKKDLDQLQLMLIEKVQNQNSNRIYLQLLIWVNLQLKDFYGAFIQAKAYDKKFNTNGSKMIEVGNIALKNNYYDDAIRSFQYMVNNYKNMPNYHLVRTYLIMAKEEKIKNTYPIDTAEIRGLIKDYNLLLKQIGFNKSTVVVLRNMAELYGFYLYEKDSAISLLDLAIGSRYVTNNTLAQCKIDLGDIYLLKNEPWESTLLYSQVEKEMKESNWGQKAKFKNAQLSYFKSDFKLAKDHLDVLKLATTREIANDAIDLSLLIHNNTALDSSENALICYAGIELLLFQHKYDTALKSLKEMENTYRNHPILDEVYWLEAKVYSEIGKYEKSIQVLDKILERYSQDILADNALYTKAVILEENLHKLEEAQELYQKFLKNYHGSVYTDDVRKRFRKLRGDQIN